MSLPQRLNCLGPENPLCLNAFPRQHVTERLPEIATQPGSERDAKTLFPPTQNGIGKDALKRFLEDRFLV